MPVSINGNGSVVGVTSVTGAGMDLIVPTSVVGASLSGGTITFNSVTSASVNGCFTSSYDNYRIMLYFTAPTTGNSYVTMRMRSSNVDASTANYDLGYSGSSAVGFQGNYNAGGTSFSIKGDGALQTPAGVSFDLMAPALSSATSIPLSSTFGTLSSNNGVLFYIQRHTLANSYDGFSLLCALAMSGTLRIYGLRNS